MALQRSGSTIPQFVRRIPSDVKERAIGRTLSIPVGEVETASITVTESTSAIRFSLKTKDPGEAKVREAKAAAYLEGVWQALRRSNVVSLTHKQATSLAGELYRAWASERVRHTGVTYIRGKGWVRDDDIDYELEEAIYENAKDKPAAELEDQLGRLIDGLLLKHGVAAVTAQSRPLLVQAFFQALKDAYELRHRQAMGDYSPDPKAGRFPEWESSEAKAGPVTITELLEGWWTEGQSRGLSRSTYKAYRSSVQALVRFLKHDDATRVTARDIAAFKDHRLAEGLSARTLANGGLPALKSVFGWGVANHKIPSSPVSGVTLKAAKIQKLRSKGFTEDEAKALLRAAAAYQRLPKEKPKTAAAKRWVPWLCAYTGARVGEVAQLRKQDVRREGDHWVLRITPEAGRVKTGEARDVVLHEHLVEAGFPEFVRKSAPGHLFVSPNAEGSVLGSLLALSNKLAVFGRETVKDMNVAPNHGWRHRFKTVGRSVGIDSYILDAIQGHAPASVADSYGDVKIDAIAAAIAKIPRIEV